MYNDHQHSPIYAATLDLAAPAASKRNLARDLVSNSRRLRQRIGVAAGLCVGLATLLITL